MECSQHTVISVIKLPVKRDLCECILSEWSEKYVSLL